MLRAGYSVVAAIDFDSRALRTHSHNLGRQVRAFEKDLTKFRPLALADAIGMDSVDVIVGGPPCQGFSTARQVDGANSGPRLKPDPRRYLYREFLRYVKHFGPKVFVMENVPGMRSAAGGAFLTAVQHEARRIRTRSNGHSYCVHTQLEDAVSLGVPQNRRRQLVIGVRSDLAGYFPAALSRPSIAPPRVTLGAAIGDLPKLNAGEGNERSVYDHTARTLHYRTYRGMAQPFLENVLEIRAAAELTAHRARPHNARDLRDFGLLHEGESSAVAMRRGVTLESPYSTKSFKDRYTRQSRYEACSTIVAHLGKDGLMFIHPNQLRSLTPREAARVQTFPDWFEFPVAKTHQFKMIGNAVPPLVGRAIGLTIKEFLASQESVQNRVFSLSQPPMESVRLVNEACRINRTDLRKLTEDEFARYWTAVLVMFPDLHPMSAADHGSTTYTHASGPGWQRLRYRRSGWPVALKELLREGWRRHAKGDLSIEFLLGKVGQPLGRIQRKSGAA